MKAGIFSVKLYILCNIIYIADTLLFSKFNCVHDVNYLFFVFIFN